MARGVQGLGQEGRNIPHGSEGEGKLQTLVFEPRTLLLALWAALEPAQGGGAGLAQGAHFSQIPELSSRVEGGLGKVGSWLCLSWLLNFPEPQFIPVCKMGMLYSSQHHPKEGSSLHDAWSLRSPSFSTSHLPLSKSGLL